MANKNWYKSKTMWINLLITAGGILTALGSELQAGITFSAIGVVNIVLRYLTNKGIK